MCHDTKLSNQVVVKAHHLHRHPFSDFSSSLSSLLFGVLRVVRPNHSQSYEDQIWIPKGKGTKAASSTTPDIRILVGAAVTSVLVALPVV